MLYAHWGKDSPVRHAGDNMACAYLNNGGVWVLSNCDDSRYSVCKRDQEIVAVADTPEGCAEVSAAVDTGYTATIGYCDNSLIVTVLSLTFDY